MTVTLERRPPVMEQHAANAFSYDERVQRSERVNRVKAIARKLDLDAVGVITGSRREDGRLVVIDGQHRLKALINEGLGDYLVTCRVFDALTLREEAGLFRRLNNTSKTTAIEDLLKGITEGDPDCVAVEKIAKRFGLRIALQKGPGLIACASAMTNLYGKNGKTGPAALGFALHVATESWGVQTESVEGHTVSGLGALYIRYGEELDRPALIRKLAKYQGGPAGLYGNALALKKIDGSSTNAKAVARIVLNVYNRGRKSPLSPL